MCLEGTERRSALGARVKNPSGTTMRVLPGYASRVIGYWVSNGEHVPACRILVAPHLFPASLALRAGFSLLSKWRGQ